jgi:hypothetical protein
LTSRVPTNSPPPLTKAKQHWFVKTRNQRRNHTYTREVDDPLTSLSQFHYENGTAPADEPVDPASEQNHIGPPGQFLTRLDSSGSVGSGGLPIEAGSFDLMMIAFILQKVV